MVGRRLPTFVWLQIFPFWVRLIFPDWNRKQRLEHVVINRFRQVLIETRSFCADLILFLTPAA